MLISKAHKIIAIVIAHKINTFVLILLLLLVLVQEITLWHPTANYCKLHKNLSVQQMSSFKLGIINGWFYLIFFFKGSKTFIAPVQIVVILVF